MQSYGEGVSVHMWMLCIVHSCLPFYMYAGGYQRLFSDAPVPPIDGPITFVAPELPEETLLEVTLIYISDGLVCFLGGGIHFEVIFKLLL